MDKVKFHQILEEAIAAIREFPIDLLEDVDTTTTPPTNGQALVWDDTPGVWVPGTVSGGGGGGSIDDLTDVDTTTTPPTDGQSLVWDATPGVWVPGTVSGGGGGSSGVLLLDWTASVPSGTPVGTLIFRKQPVPHIYDFTQGALPTGWSKHGTPTETFSGAGMAVTFVAGQGYHINTPVTGDFTVEMKMTALGSQGTMFGPGITDASGTGVQCSWYNAPAGVLTEAISSYNYASSFTNGGGTFALPNRIRVKKVGTLYTSSYSFNEGSSWSVESASLSSSITPARVNIGSAFSGSTITVTEVKVQEISNTSNAGTAKGWWDGSAIQPLG